ncbi:MAG: exodeoxyribonuclease VII large subunit [Candidatus Omnitrophica bacterium]|nr:exodeoxyribonuclease VII large subunit [Candidatus Omnitrophota bacterium]
MDNLFEDKHIFSVCELTRDIHRILEDNFPAVWVEGEISTLRIPQSGHIYFTLKDEKAQLKCVFFKRANSNLNFKLEEGLSCILFGRVSVYDQGGQYQLYVEKIEPRGKGALQLAFEQLKNKLLKEGLFDQARKRPIPFLAKKIGIVTSATGAAIRDILQVINRRYANAHIIIRPSLVQGKTAAKDISDAIEELNDFAGVDVIIVARGGGSLEDLWPFNEEILARAVYNSKIPVISAVGHEIDYTICDFVADLRAPTPSAAAELVVREKSKLIAELTALQNRLQQVIMKKIELAQADFERVKHSYALRRPQKVVEQYQQRLDNVSLRFSNFKVVLEGIEQKIGNLDQRMATLILHKMKLKQSLLEQISSRLINLNPLAILSRGYSVTYLQQSKEAIKGSDKVRKGDIIETKLHKGVIISQVEETKS